MKNNAITGKALFLSFLFTLSLSSHAAVNAQNARKQIYNQAVATATADIQRIAKQRKWQDYTSKLNVFIPSEVTRFTRCDRPLISSLPAGDRRDLARLRYDIRCEGHSSWEVAVTIKPDIYLPVLVAKNTLERGKLLSAADVEMKKHNVVGLRDGFLSSPDDVVGHTLKKRVRDLQPIAPSHLMQAIMVERGQHVLMLAEENGVEARMMGEAMKKGRKGDMIKVRNLSSQKVVNAIIDGPAVVRMLVAPGNP